MITTKDLSFGYNGRKVIDNITLRIGSGRITGILGPNGAGKSTLLKLLGGYMKSDAGDIFIDGKNIRGMSAREKSKIISFVAQNYNFSFPYSCYDFVMMGRFPYLGSLGFEKEEDVKIAEEAMILTSTAYLKDRMINTLSGGEAQRVLIAQAIASRAPILFLDEPVNHLDIKYQIEILDLIKKLKVKKNMTMAMVIHDLNLAFNYCDEVILLKNGSLYTQGAPNETINQSNIFNVFDVNVKSVKEGKNNFIFPVSSID